MSNKKEIKDHQFKIKLTKTEKHKLEELAKFYNTKMSKILVALINQPEIINLLKL